jgi:hypothetical protein
MRRLPILVSCAVLGTTAVVVSPAAPALAALPTRLVGGDRCTGPHAVDGVG